ncbi:MAG TPA: beta-propeller domain-containing protein, partial [Phycisphaerae bacterium]
MQGTLRRSCGLVAVLMVAAGCRTNIRVEPPGSNPPSNQNDNSTPRESGIAEMRRFASEQEFQQYFTAQVTLENQQPEHMPGAGLSDNSTANPGSNLGGSTADGTAGGLAGAPVPGTAPGAEPPRNDDGFSGTTIQEAGVDEADVVKTDGTYLYIISDGKLRIVQAVPADELKQVGEFELNGYGQDMYLFGDRVVTVTAPDFPIYALGGGGVVMGAPGAAAEGDAGGGVPEQTAPPSSGDPTMVDPGLPVGGGDTGFLPPIYYRPQVEVTVIDVSDKTAPALVTSTKFDGSLGASRMIDGVLHLVVANYPVFWADVLPLGRPEAVAMASSMDTATVLPNFEMTKPDGSRESGDAVSWGNLFHPVDPDGFGMSLLISLDVRQPDHFNSLGIVADPGLIYSS